jgi:hypothetical protein
MSYSEFSDYYGDDDVDDGVMVLGMTEPVAKKEHTCTLCKRTINPGERYRRYRLITEDGPFTQKECDDCIYQGWSEGIG